MKGFGSESPVRKAPEEGFTGVLLKDKKSSSGFTKQFVYLGPPDRIEARDSKGMRQPKLGGGNNKTFT